MSLLRDIRNAAIDPTIGLSAVLLKAKVLAAYLKNKDLADWLDRELNGYPAEVEIPKYREIQGMVYGRFALPFQQVVTLQIPPSVLPENLRHWGELAYLREPIATYAAVLAKSANGATAVRFPWPTEMARLYGSEAYERAQCVEAWLAAEPSVLAGLLDSVRSRVLGFALAIEAENPQAGEADIRSTPVEPTKVSQHFQTIIYGGTNNVATGGSNLSQTITIQPGDFEALRSSLQAAGAKDCEIEELKAELSSTQNLEERQRRADSWIGRTARQAYAAARAFAVDISAKAIAEFLRPPGLG